MEKTKEKQPLNTYEVRVKVTKVDCSYFFLNGLIMAKDSVTAKKRSREVIAQKYNHNQNRKIEVVKCTKKHVNFFIKQVAN